MMMMMKIYLLYILSIAKFSFSGASDDAMCSKTDVTFFKLLSLPNHGIVTTDPQSYCFIH